MARVAVVALLLVIAFVYSEPDASIEIVAPLAYATAVTLLLAFPDVRSADLVTVTAIMMTVAEFLEACSGGRIDGFRWLVAMAAIGAAVLPLRAQRVRTLALFHPYRSFAESDRRKRRAMAPAPAPVMHTARSAPAPSQRVLPAPINVVSAE